MSKARRLYQTFRPMARRLCHVLQLDGKRVKSNLMTNSKTLVSILMVSGQRSVWGMRHTSTALYFFRASRKSLHKPRANFRNMLFKGTVQRDFLTLVFFPKRLILVSISMTQSDFEIFRIFAEFFVLKLLKKSTPRCQLQRGVKNRALGNLYL
jgi:hypothetical protein